MRERNVDMNLGHILGPFNLKLIITDFDFRPKVVFMIKGFLRNIFAPKIKKQYIY